jgi:prephenate dehydrogenase (NADP+)
MLESALEAALYDKSIRADDLEFVKSTQNWSQVILLGSMTGYRDQFGESSAFFENKLNDAKEMSTRLLELVGAKWRLNRQNRNQ